MNKKSSYPLTDYSTIVTRHLLPEPILLIQEPETPRSLPIPDMPTQDLQNSGLQPSEKTNNRGRRKKILLRIVIIGHVFIFIIVGFLYAYYRYQLPHIDAYMHESTPIDSRIYDRNNVLLYEAYNQKNNGRRIPVTLQEIPQVMQDAMTATEDRTFWTNPGINVVSMLRAALTHDGGGSTLSQQLIKNLSHNDQHTLTRKFWEANLAIGLNQKYTKAQILAMYFNVVSFGAFDFGVESAAEEYFHLQSTCQDNGTCIPGIERLEYNDQGQRDPILGLARASLLAGIPNEPSIIDPTLGAQAKQWALARQKIVLQAMIASHMSVDGQKITVAMARQAEDITAHTDFTSYSHVKRAPHFVDWIINQLALQLGNGNYAKGLQTFEEGGFTVRTTIDVNLEEYVERAVDQHLDQPDYQYYPLQLRGDQILSKTLNIHSGAVVVLDAKTGEILAMDGSAGYSSSNPEVGGQYNMAAPLAGSATNPSGRPPGATMLPIDYMAAYEELASSGSATGGQATNATSNLRDMAQRLGITVPQNMGESFAEGAENVSLLQMTDAYQALADNGQHVPSVGILAVYDHNGHPIYQYNPAQPPATSVVSPQIASAITLSLRNESQRRDSMGDYRFSFADQDATCAVTLFCQDQVAAQSSDTSSSENGNTMIGYTPDVVVGVWVGNVNGAKMDSAVVGTTGALPIWHSVIERALGWCGTQATASPYFSSDKVACGPAPHLRFSASPTRTFLMQ